MYSLNFIILLFIGFVDMLGIGLVYPLFAAMMFDSSSAVLPQDASPVFRGAMLGLLIALTPLVQFISSPILGALSDLKGRRPVLAAGVGMGCLGYFIATIGVWTNSIWLLLAYRLCVGVSEGTIPVAQAALVDISGEENKARRFSILGGVLGLGFAVGPYLGGKLSDPLSGAWASYALPFIVAGAMSSLNFLLVIFCLPETRKVITQSRSVVDSFRNIPKILAWPNLRWLFIGGFALAFGWSFFQEFVPLFLRERFGWGASHTGDYYAFCGLMYAVSSGFFTGLVLNRFSADRVITKALCVSAISVLTFLLIPTADYVWAIVPPLMYSIALAWPTSTAMVSDQASGEMQGEILGVFQSVQAAAMALSPLLMGPLVGFIPIISLWGGAAAFVLAALAFRMARRRKAAVFA